MTVIESDLAPQLLAPDAYAILASRIPDPNGGLIHGRNASLAIDLPADIPALHRIDTAVPRPATAINLGGRVVELRDFGTGTTIVHLPEARTVWTGRYLCHAGIPPRVGRDPQAYLDSLYRIRDELPFVDTIVPGYGPPGSFLDAIDWSIGYLERLIDDIGGLAGYPIGQLLHRCHSPFDNGLDHRLVVALSGYRTSPAGCLKLCRNLHLLNVLTTYKSLERRKR